MHRKVEFMLNFNLFTCIIIMNRESDILYYFVSQGNLIVYFKIKSYPICKFERYILTNIYVYHTCRHTQAELVQRELSKFFIIPMKCPKEDFFNEK